MLVSWSKHLDKTRCEIIYSSLCSIHLLTLNLVDTENVAIAIMPQQSAPWWIPRLVFSSLYQMHHCISTLFRGFKTSIVRKSKVT